MRTPVYLVGMFVDRIKVFAKAGDGGRGCVSFRREKFVPRGGPDGGDGGKGGDVILRADEHTDNLAALFYEPLLKAKTGGHGQGKQMHGRGAPAKMVKVPVGTVVHRVDSLGDPSVFMDSGAPAAAESGVMLEQIADLALPNEEFILCRGGRGGKGNVHFKSSRNRAPRQYSEGEEGEEGNFILELRTIADAGLVGYPNAGKSTLLRRISAAHPKVAPYPFTTLHPMIGVVEFDDFRRATVADIPGLIEGAHQNLGLGHAFLRHITRCRLLLFVLDMAGSEGRNPIDDLQHLRREIDLYDPRLSLRPWLVVANKMDLPEATDHLRALRRRYPDRAVVPVSAKEQEGVEDLKDALDIRLHQPDMDKISPALSSYAGTVSDGRSE
jgi:GTP-binding protein